MTDVRTIIDISRAITPGGAVYPGDEPLGESPVCVIGGESPCSITALNNWTTHFLTHVDPPSHFIDGGDSLDAVPLSTFYCQAEVRVVSGDAVRTSDIPQDLRGRAILFKTNNSSLSTDVFHEDHAYIAEEAVSSLVNAAPGLVGFDYLSVDRFGDEDYPVHRGLLGAGIVILEGLDLTGVQPGIYDLVALPLKISGADGSPVRAVLIS
jgi:arylformamidase